MTAKRYFTFEECQQIALKYDKRSEFKEKDRTCFNFAKKNGWYDEISKHMKHKSPRYDITFEEAKSEALKYKTRMEFKEKNGQMYSYCVRNKILDEVCKHMKKIGNKYKRCVYVYEFNQCKTCYIGLTFNLKYRHWQHIIADKTSKVYKFCKEKNIKDPSVKMLSDYIEHYKAAELEKYYIEKYKQDGWKVLNIAPGGSLGGNKKNEKVTIDLCKKNANKCKNLTEFAQKFSYQYKLTKKNNWDDYVLKKFKTKEYKKMCKENISKSLKGKKKNIDKERKYMLSTCKPVEQLDLDGNVIATFRSISEAANSLGHKHALKGISACCNGKKNYKTCLGFKWRFVVSKENNVSKIHLL